MKGVQHVLEKASYCSNRLLAYQSTGSRQQAYPYAQATYHMEKWEYLKQANAFKPVASEFITTSKRVTWLTEHILCNPTVPMHDTKK
ncbi:hypothetical protein [Oceanobacillus kapialis]|uniref:hypothetical protein n=1 Tax=Oceanobacillus kapialis TaxID=481353 RepID=UPI00384F1897